MEHFKEPDHDITYKGPPDDDNIGDLYCKRVRFGDGSRAIYSRWFPNEEELAMLNKGGCIELGIHAEPIPPVSLNVEMPTERFIVVPNYDPDPDGEVDERATGVSWEVIDTSDRTYMSDWFTEEDARAEAEQLNKHAAREERDKQAEQAPQTREAADDAEERRNGNQ